MRYAKAIVAGGLALCGSLGTALADGQLTTVEIVTAVGATLAALAVVWAVPNKAPQAP